MKKLIAMALVTFLLTTSLAFPCLGETYSVNAVDKNKVVLGLSLSNGTAKVQITQFLMIGYTGTSSITLQKKEGNNWTNIKTWNPAKSGQQYTISVTTGTYRAISSTQLSKPGQGIIDILNNYTSEKRF